MYKDWAEGQINKIKGILYSAKAGHTSAVKQRIESVKQLGSVVDVTKQLFEVSKVGILQEAIFAHGPVHSLALGNRQA